MSGQKPKFEARSAPDNLFAESPVGAEVMGESTMGFQVLRERVVDFLQMGQQHTASMQGQGLV